MNAPLVSVVMPLRNAEATLSGTLESLLGQTYPHLEFVLVDDAQVRAARERAARARDRGAVRPGRERQRVRAREGPQRQGL